MTYNRCVGTRYCSNNCPYKVRHFNFFQYSDATSAEPDAPEQPRRDRAGAGRDGEVHVLRPADQRARGSTAKEEGRPIRDGEVVTACQAACPTRAIVFGNINDPDERGVASSRPTRGITGMLAELNTRPRTTYLARLRNPNPEIEPEARRWRPATRTEPSAGDGRPRPVLAPGHTLRLGHRQDQLARPGPPLQLAVVRSGSASASLLTMLLLVAVAYLLLQGRRHLGHRRAR